MIKPTPQEPLPEAIDKQTRHFFGTLMQLLHPFMPFITEEVWHQLAPRGSKEAIAVSLWPKINKPDHACLEAANHAFALLKKLRNVRKQYQVPKTHWLSLVVANAIPDWLDFFKVYLQHSAQLKEIRVGSDSKGVGLTIANAHFQLLGIENQEQVNDKEALHKSLFHAKAFSASLKRKLANSAFLDKAPEAVIALEQKKSKDLDERVKQLMDLLDSC